MPLQNAWHGQLRQKSQEIMVVLKPHPWPEATFYSSCKLWTPWELRIPTMQRGRSQAHHYIMQQLLPMWYLNGIWCPIQCRVSCLCVPAGIFGESCLTLPHTNTWWHQSPDLLRLTSAFSWSYCLIPLVQGSASCRMKAIPCLFLWQASLWPPQ